MLDESKCAGGRVDAVEHCEPYSGSQIWNSPVTPHVQLCSAAAERPAGPITRGLQQPQDQDAGLESQLLCTRLMQGRACL